MLCGHDPRNRRDAMRIDAIKVYLDTKPAARLSRQRKGPIYQTGFPFETAQSDIIRQWHALFHNGMYGVKQHTTTKSVIFQWTKQTRRDTDWTR